MQHALISKYAQIYRQELLDRVIPFWEKYSRDREFGGYFTCLERDGAVVDTDKFMWLQGRQVWMFSYLYNELEARPGWLEMAQCGADFMRQYGRDEAGDWYFSLERTGKPLVAAYNIFSDCFAVLAMSEYGHAAQQSWAQELALQTYRRIQERRENPKGRFSKQIGATRKMLSLALPMITIGMTDVINRHFQLPELEKIIDENIELVLGKFVDTSLKTVFEHVNPDGSHPNSLDGRLLSPGHTLEAMWFMLEVARRRNNDALIQTATEAIRWTIERGWDQKYGGIFYFMDDRGYSPDRLDWDMKLWWVHLEALYALALAHFLTADPYFENWFKKVHDYTWEHFPDPEYGEWFGYLNRRGEVTHTLKGGKWKGCFHVPRGLFLTARLFENKLQESPR